jgi:uncharacterized protein YqhQ
MIVVAPGLWLQRLTTRPPDDDQLEVALAALRKTLWREQAGGDPASDSTPTVEVVDSYRDVAYQESVAE